MLKTLCAVTLLLSTIIQSSAQTISNDNYQPDIPLYTGNKTTGNKVSWLMADVRRGMVNGTSTDQTDKDSIVFYYKPGMHQFDSVLKGWRAFEYARYTYDKTSKTDVCQIRSFGNYNSAGQGIGGKWQFLDAVTGTWKDGGNDSFIYNSMGQLYETISIQFDRFNNVWQLPKKTQYSYDSRGRKADITAYEFSNSTWNRLGSEVYNYLGNSDTLVGSLTHPDKNANERIIIKSIEYVYVSGRLVKRNSIFSSAAIDRDIYDYTNMPRMTHWTYRTSDSTVGKIDTTRGIWTFNNRGLLDSTYRVDVAGVVPRVPGHGTHYVYNSYDQMIAKRELNLNKANNRLEVDFEQLWYYGEYNVGIDAKQDEVTSIKLYPVPASQLLNIEVKTASEGELLLALCNTDGRLIRTWNQPMSDNIYTERLDISFLSPGNYILQVYGPHGRTSKQFSVLK